MTWTDRIMRDATGVSSADPVLVDYFLARIEPPLQEALIQHYQGVKPARPSQRRSGLRAIRAVIVKDTIFTSVSPYRRTLSTRDIRAIDAMIEKNAGLSWEEYQALVKSRRE